MKAYINSYESMSCAGNTSELMESIYNKTSAISIDETYIKNTPVGLGKMKNNNFFEVLHSVVSEVLQNSNLKNFHNTLLIVGSSVGGIKESEEKYFKDKNYKRINPARHAINVIGDSLNEKFDFLDTRSISTACTSSANALLLAKRLIDVEAYENILVVGADSLCYTTVCGFSALGVLSSKNSTPFSKDREGMNVAEAVAALLVQNKSNDNSIELLGVGASSDAYHMTNPDPHAMGAISSMQKALDNAKLKSSDIDYINAHGTGTEANDRVEALAVETLFEDTFMSSTKAITGHTLGAAGALEAIVSCESIKRGLIIPQASMIEIENKNINIPLELVKKEINYVISNSFAFGGNNTSLVFGAIKCVK